jgi:hypothetical protein
VDGGKTFEPIRDLIEDSTIIRSQTHIPGIIANRNNVYIIFPYPNTRLWMIKSTDHGTTWDSPRNITTMGASILYQTAIYGDTLACTFDDGGYNKLWRSANSGISSTTNTLSRSRDVSVALTPGTLHLVQHEWNNNAEEIQYLRSSNLGASWNKNIILSEIDGFYSDIPTIAGFQTESGTELLAAWRDVKYGGWGLLGASIISRTSLDNGNTWFPETLLTQRDLPNGFEPKAAVHGNTRAVVWNTEWDTTQADASLSNTTYLPACLSKTITGQTLSVGGVQMAISSHTVHVVFEMYRPEIGRYAVVYRRGEFVHQNGELSLSKSFISFDTTEMNTRKSDSILVTNTGTDSLIIGTAITSNDVFSIEPESMTIAPSKSGRFLVVYTPQKQGIDNGKVFFFYNGFTSPDYIPVSGKGKWGVTGIAYPQGWQIVSIPIEPGPNQSLPSMYEFNEGYVPSSSMEFGKGYWAKPPDTVYYLGGNVLSDSVTVRTGWNIIGALSKPSSLLSMTSEPTNIIDSPFYGYNSEGYYVAEILQPGMGYWVKIKHDGKLFLRTEELVSQKTR